MPKFCDNCTEIIREYLPMPRDYTIKETPLENYITETKEEIEPKIHETTEKATEHPQIVKTTRSYEGMLRDNSFDLHQRIAAAEREKYGETPDESLEEIAAEHTSEIQQEINPETEPSVIPEYDLNLEPNYEPIYGPEYEIEPEFDTDSNIEADLDQDFDSDADQDQDISL